MPKRLKSLDEGTAPQIVNNIDLKKAIIRNSLKSKTYAHNKKVRKEDIKKHKTETSAPVKKSMSIFQSILKSMFYIAVIIIAVILLIAISTN